MPGVNHLTGENGDEFPNVIAGPGGDAVIKYVVDDATWCEGIDYDGDGTNRPFKIAKTGPLGTGDVISFEGTVGQDMRLPQVPVTTTRAYLAIDNTTKSVSASQPGVFFNANTAIGESALDAPSTATSNSCFGAFAGQAVDTGNSNVMVGSFAGTTLESGDDNVFVGYLAGSDAVGSSNGTFVGYKTGQLCTADGNTYVGYKAGQNATGGTKNVCLGASAGAGLTSAGSTIAIGDSALLNATTNSFNIGIGTDALKATTGIYNCAIGQQTMLANLGGTHNGAFGVNSLKLNETGTDNNAFGSTSLAQNIIGNQNTAIGSSALVVTTGNANTGLGYLSKVQAGLDNSTAVGANSNCTASNQIVLGDASVTEVKTAAVLTYPKPFGEMWATAFLLTGGLTNGFWDSAPFTTTVANAANQSFSHTSPNQMEYTGALTKNFHIICTLSGGPDANTDTNWEFSLFVNAGLVSSSIVSLTSKASLDRYNATLQAVVELQTGYVVDLRIRRTSGTSDWTTEYMNMFIEALPNEV